MDNLSDRLLALEEQLLQPAIRTDAEAMDKLLAGEFREFGSSGRIFTKREIIGLLSSEAPSRITLHDYACQLLSPEIALVTYLSRAESGKALRSSIWIHREGRWRMLFHQGTKVLVPPDANAVS